MSTRDVWPWSLLVPWMEEDLRRRASENASHSLTGPLDPYDNPSIMPLRDFVNAPIVQDLLHNGAALQVRSSFSCSQPLISQPVSLACLI